MTKDTKKSFLADAAVRGSAAVLARQVGLIVLALIVATIFLAISGYPPLAIVNGLWDSLTGDIAGTIRWATPLMLAGLAVALTFKAGYWNLGVDGQLYIGAVLGAWVALALPAGFPGPLGILVVFVACMVGGALYALIPALLKVYLRVDELVATLLLNFVAVLFVEAMVTGPLRDPNTTTNLNATAPFREEFWLPRIEWLQPSLANWGFYIAVIACVIIAFVFFRMTTGQEIKMVGANPRFADYVGVRPKRLTITVFLASGSIAGLIGAIEVTAIQHRLLAGFNPNFGMEGVVVSLLANNNPIGVFASGLFFGALRNGGINMERVTDVPASVTDIVMAIVIIFLGARFAFPWVKKLLARRRAAAVETTD